MKHDLAVEYLKELRPLVFDVSNVYETLRRGGKDRAGAMESVFREFDVEANDAEDRLAVLIGLTLAMCKWRELVQDVQQETVRMIDDALKTDHWGDAAKKSLMAWRNTVADGKMLGGERRFAPKKNYVPDWKTGDTFAHRLTCPQAEKLGISGWYVLFTKCGEYENPQSGLQQLVYAKVCPPEQLPAAAEEYDRLPYVVMQWIRRGVSAEYLGQLSLQSRYSQRKFELQWIGNFASVLPPALHAEENPLVAKPIFSAPSKECGCPSYENSICLYYCHNGTCMPRQE